MFTIHKNRYGRIVMRYYPNEWKGKVEVIEQYHSSTKAAQRAEQLKHELIKAKKVVRNRGRT